MNTLVLVHFPIYIYLSYKSFKISYFFDSKIIDWDLAQNLKWIFIYNISDINHHIHQMTIDSYFYWFQLSLKIRIIKTQILIKIEQKVNFEKEWIEKTYFKPRKTVKRRNFYSLSKFLKILVMLMLINNSEFVLFIQNQCSLLQIISVFVALY